MSLSHHRVGFDFLSKVGVEVLEQLTESYPHPVWCCAGRAVAAALSTFSTLSESAVIWVTTTESCVENVSDIQVNISWIWKSAAWGLACWQLCRIQPRLWQPEGHWCCCCFGLPPLDVSLVYFCCRLRPRKKANVPNAGSLYILSVHSKARPKTALPSLLVLTTVE